MSDKDIFHGETFIDVETDEQSTGERAGVAVACDYSKVRPVIGRRVAVYVAIAGWVSCVVLLLLRA